MAKDNLASARSVGTGESPAIPAVSARATHPAVEAILRRRSAREQFTDRPIPGAVLIEIVRCGLAAPSSKNAQPWRLHVVSDRAVLAELAEAVETSRGADSYSPMDPLTGEPHPDWPSTVALSASILRAAATGIFIENRSSFSRSRRTLIEAIQGGRIGSLISYSFEIIGIGAAIQNMWIAAEAFGVRGCYLGDVVIAEEEISRRLGIEKDLMGVLALGYSEAPISPRSLPDMPIDTAQVVWHGSPGS